MTREQQLQTIAGEIRACPLCRKGGTGVAVPGEGNAAAEVLFIGEAPGRMESVAGKPFLGRSGKFLDRMLAEIGLARPDIFITSPVHYLPVAGTPSREMIAHGRIHLLKQLHVIRPRVTVLMGSTACRALLDGPVEVAREHGRILEKDGFTFLITFHPAYAMRFRRGKTGFSQDLGKLRELLEK